MKAFIIKTLLFSVLLLSCLLLSLFFIKDNHAENSILGAIKDKQALLRAGKGQRIIFVGGSNLSFGLNSQQIEKQFNQPVINMGLNVGLGLRFILDDVKRYIHKGDLVVVVPEYECFYSANFYGEMELVSTLFDVVPNEKTLIGQQQWLHLLKYLPVYSAIKIKNFIFSLISKTTPTRPIDIYSRYSFNKYGDAFLHWEMPDQSFLIAQKSNTQISICPDVIPYLKEFKTHLYQQQAQLLLLPPVIEKNSFENMENSINTINLVLHKNGIPFFSHPKTYMYSKHYFFNSYYHLNKKGALRRTHQLIDDIDYFLNANKRK